jgi:NAD dependent epimerase/dehydratase family enzyme
MMATYRRLLSARFGLPAPAPLATLGAPLLGSSGSLALTGRRCVPTRLLADGFTFTQPDFAETARLALRRCGAL